ncbi:MAG TPA: hypothetical protein VJC09_01175 [Candidatus Saccharimonadales bacterium]|nr:hypothetical protein [Candidatus Saccharimonadales bacterium]
MTVIKGNCETCGDDVDLREDDVTLIHEKGQDKYFYRFKCPDGFINLNEAPAGTVDPLLSAQVKVIEIDVSESRINEGLPAERIMRHPFTEADQVAFHQQMVRIDPVDLVQNFERGE